MKKFILFILLGFATFTGYSQEYCSYSVGVSTGGDYYFKGMYPEGTFTAFMQHNHKCFENVYWRLTANFVMLRLPNEAPDIRLGIGMQAPVYGNFYGFAEVFPSIGIVGIAQQVNGDYMAFYLPINIGVGYNLELTREHILSFELSMEKDFTVYSSIRDQLRDDISVKLMVKYSYKFFADE